MSDQGQRDRIRSDLSTTFLVEAAAGTGKTTELIQRIVATVGAGAQLERIVAVTFTDKAAGELKLRLRGELENARRKAEGAPKASFTAALAALEAAPIGTIHSFCGDILRERPVEAEIDPAFEVCAEDQSEELIGRAFDEWFQQALSDPPDGVRRVLRLRRWGWDEGPRELLRRAATTLIHHRDFDAAWSRPPFERKARLAALVDRLRELGDLVPQHPDSTDYLRKGLLRIHQFIKDHDTAAEARRGRRYDDDSEQERDEADAEDRLEAEVRSLLRETRDSKPWKWTGSRYRDFAGRPRSEVLALRDEVKAELDAFCQDAEADLAAALQLELTPVVGRYVELLERSGRLDFLDLLYRVRNLLVSKKAVRAMLQERYTHLFVDEFQDTDPLQAELLLLLASGDPDADDWEKVRLQPGKLFVVGDPKQSVYRFRRADVSVYEKVRERVVSAGGEVLQLSTSFRAVPSLQRFVNAAFAPLMGDGEPGRQARYVPLEPQRPEVSSQPTLVALPIPRPYGDFGAAPFAGKIEQSLPDAIGAFVAWLVRESGWTIEESETRRPVAARDICLLFSRMTAWRNDVTRPYVEALRARSIPHVLQGGRSFHEREEIVALHQALVAIEWPDDALAVHAVLRGPLFAFPDRDLLAFKQDAGPLHPFVQSDTPEHQEVQAALDVLRELHLSRNRRPIADTVSELLERTRAQAGFAFWHAPRQTLANLSRMIDHARRFDARGTTSFRAFVRWLDSQQEKNAAGDAPFLEDGIDGVRLMTVHKAKGLEFGVVILCDPTARAQPTNPTRYVDPHRRLWAAELARAIPRELHEHRDEVLEADAAERIRLAYVAATRARDLMVIPTVGDGPSEGWLRLLSEPLYPPLSLAPEPIPGCDVPVGNDTVLERNDKVEPRPVRSGFYRHRGVDVAWWDPSALKLDAPPKPGLNRIKLLAADGPGAKPGLEKYQEWKRRRGEVRQAASQTSAWTRTVTELALEEPPQGRPVTVARTGAWQENRPRGARFGTLVHAILADAPFDSDEPAVDRLSKLHGRLLGATQEEREAATEAVIQALGHPIIQRAAQSEHFRERSILHTTDDGTILEGVIDLLFADEVGGAKRWVVVDYKTDLGAGAPDEYITQVELYADAIEAATGLRADPILLSV